MRELGHAALLDIANFKMLSSKNLKKVVRLAVAVDDMGRVNMSQRVQHLVMDRGKSPLGDLERRLGAEDTAGGPRADPRASRGRRTSDLC